MSKNSRIQRIVEGLISTERGMLMIAFEAEEAKFIELSNSFFIGVNVQAVPILTILESEGVWSYGKINF